MTTYKEDFLSKFPKARTGSSGVPIPCRADIYGRTGCLKPCIDCWNKEMPTEKLEVKEVKRRANAGEYIKIISPFCANGRYKVNDIFKITVDFMICCGTTINGSEVVFCRDEYVVLENYKPEEKTEPKKEPKYKVGDKVKLKEFPLCSFALNLEVRAKIFTISRLCPDFYYEFEEDYILGSLREDMIESIAKPYTGKVVCLDTCKCSIYTVGKCYQFKEGKFFDKNDSKFLCPLIYSFDQWTKFSSAKWLEIVED